MQKGKLYKQCDSLAVTESLPDNEFKMIYLDVPYCTGTNEFAYDDGSKSIRVHLARERECSIGIHFTESEVNMKCAKALRKN